MSRAASGSHVVLTLAFAAWTAAPRAAADVNASYLDGSTYVYTISHVPDLDQKRALLPGTGFMYCVPTSALNWMAYFANHGAGWLAPGPGNWQSAALYNTMTTHIYNMGELMGTHETNGTSGAGGTNGIIAWVPPSSFAVTHEYCNDSWCPDFDYMSLHVFNGAYVMTGIGWYTEFKFDPDVIQRAGGHCLSLTYGARSGDEMVIGWRDPASDEGLVFAQSPFTTEQYPIEQRYVAPIQVSNNPRWMSKVVGYDTAYIDDVRALYPQFVLTSQPDDPSSLTIVAGLLPNGSYIPSTRFFADVLDTPLIDITLHADLLSVIMITEAALPGDPPQLKRFWPSTGQIEVLDAGLAAASRVIVGRRRGVYVVDGDDVVCLDIDVPEPQEVIRITPPGPVDAMTYDDGADEVVMLSVGTGQTFRYPWHLDALPTVLQIPKSVNLAGRASMSWDRATGALWIVSDGSDSLYRVEVQELDGEQVLVPQEITLAEVSAPRAVDVDDDGRVLVSTMGQIVEIVPLGTSWVVAPDPIYPNVAAAQFVHVARSSTNYDPDIYGGPEWNNVLPEQAYGEPIPDCVGDIDGDGVVGILDFLYLLGVWGTDDPFADIAPDGGDLTVGIEDFLVVLGTWGACP